MDMTTFEICSLIIISPPCLVALIFLWEKYIKRDRSAQQTREQQIANAPPAPVFRLRTLSRLETGQKSLTILNLVSLISIIPLLLFDIGFIIYSIKNGFESNYDVISVLLLIALYGVPAYTLLDILYFQPRKRRRGRSDVAKEATIELDGDIEALFARCQQVILDMRGRIISLKRRPRTIESELGNNKMTIKIQRTRSGRNRIYILSDAKWITVRFDRGQNQANVDEFIRRVSG